MCKQLNPLVLLTGLFIATAVAMPTTVYSQTTDLATRTWTDIGGRTIQAELVRSDGKTATLRMGGKLYTVPLTRLSASDRAYITKVQPREESTPVDTTTRPRADASGGETNPDKQPPAPSEDNGAFKEPKVKQAEKVPGIMYENGAPPGIGRPTHQPSKGKNLIEVEGEFFFPKTKQWDLTDLQLETQDGKKHSPMAINYAYIYYLADEGAFVSVWDDGGIRPVEGLPLTPNRVKFLGEWNGGTVNLKLAFEIPEDETPKRLHHGNTSVSLSADKASLRPKPSIAPGRPSSTTDDSEPPAPAPRTRRTRR